MVQPDLLIGEQDICFGDCMNINLEKGPFLTDMGPPVGDEFVPKKFLWCNPAPTKLKKQ